MWTKTANFVIYFINANTFSNPTVMLQSIYNDIISPDVTLAGAIAKLVLSLLLGAVIGIERRRKGQIAGLRTFALISMGATLAMLISIYIPQVYLGLKNGDPGRIAAQVVSGVSHYPDERLGERIDYRRRHLDDGMYRAGSGSRHVSHLRYRNIADYLHPGQHRTY